MWCSGPVFSGEAVSGSARLFSQPRSRGHIFACDFLIKQAQAIQNRIMQCLFHMRKSSWQWHKIFIIRHFCLPQGETLFRFRPDTVLGYVPPKWRVITLCNIMHVDEVAELINLPGHKRIICGTTFVAYFCWIFQMEIREDHELHNGSVNRCGFQWFKKTGGQTKRDAITNPSIFQPSHVQFYIIAWLNLMAERCFDFSLRAIRRKKLI